MFMSEVDRQKYPAVTQKMRFEKVNPADTEDQKKEEAPKSEIQPEIQTERKTEIKKWLNHSPSNIRNGKRWINNSCGSWDFPTNKREQC